MSALKKSLSSPASSKESLTRFLPKSWGAFRELVGFLAPYKQRLGLGLLAGVGFAAVNSSLLLLIQKLGDTAFLGKFNSSDLAHGAGIGQGEEISHFWWMVLPIPAVMILRGLLAYANVYCLTWVSLKALRDMQRRIFGHLLGQSLDFFNKSQSGRLLSRVLNDTRVAQEALVSIVGELVKQPLAAIGIIAVLIHIDWKFTCFPWCSFPSAWCLSSSTVGAYARPPKLCRMKPGSWQSFFRNRLPESE